MIDTQILVQRVYWWSYIILIAFFIGLRNSFTRWRVVKIFFLLLFWGFFVRMRFIEPQQIIIQHTAIDLWLDKKVAFIADMHLWAYKDWHYLQRVVNEIRSQEVDLVLIGWDFLFHPTRTQSFEELFAPLQYIDVPVYAVLWNHDIESWWNQERLWLRKVLESYNIRVMKNDLIWIDDFYLAGLGPHLWGEDDVTVLNKVNEKDTVIVLTHNPDTVEKYTNSKADVTLVGHTHCWQIRFPYIHDRVRPKYYPVKGDFDCGLSEEYYTSLYITPWLGETILPIRFQNPPTLDILHF